MARCIVHIVVEAVYIAGYYDSLCICVFFDIDHQPYNGTS